MTDSENSNRENGSNTNGIGQLIRIAGAREAVQPERFKRAREKVHAHWQNVVQEERQVRKSSVLTRYALAASLVLAVAAAILLWPTGLRPPAQMAEVDRVIGQVLIAGNPATLGTVIEAGKTIETKADGRIAVRLAGGQSLRLDSDSRLHVQSARHLSLASGAVYVDSSPILDSGSITIATAFGDARDIGTQFQVRLEPTHMIVGVREGLVEVSREGQDDFSVDSGMFLELQANGTHEEGVVPSNDPEWDWVETVAPVFQLEGSTLDQYLTWYARERGLRLRWTTENSYEAAKATDLYGTIDGLSPAESLDTVRRIATFEYRIDGTDFWVTMP